MKTVSLIPLFLLSLISCKQASINETSTSPLNSLNKVDTSEMTNNFYDNTESYSLPVKQLRIEGEVANPGEVDFSVLPVRSVIVKETLLDSAGGDRFTGAYRYDGYSLFDILDKSILKKLNSAEFNPIIDIYIEIENDKGEKVVFSWGEIYYPNNLHKILVASSVSRIVPSKTKELWPLPVESKIVAANDLVTERNISSPVKITVRSFARSFTVNRNLSPLYSSKIDIFRSSEKVGEIATIPGNQNEVIFNTIFYGRGKGIHSTTPFTGIMIKDLILPYYRFSKNNIMSGILCFAGIDGYRCAVSYSEIFNRNDQQEFLLVKTAQGEDGGLYRIFAAPDFFSDRAIKSVCGIYLNQ